jgi:hypothetical protein
MIANIKSSKFLFYLSLYPHMFILHSYVTWSIVSLALTFPVLSLEMQNDSHYSRFEFKATKLPLVSHHPCHDLAA